MQLAIAENPDIKFVVPKEGSDLWADTMVVLKSSKNKEAAHAFINYILDPRSTPGSPRTSCYKVPNKAAMERAGRRAAGQLPEPGMTPAELLKGEWIVDLGETASRVTRIATEVAAQQ